jgi:hypothetical protein
MRTVNYYSYELGRSEFSDSWYTDASKGVQRILTVKGFFTRIFPSKLSKNFTKSK